MAKFRSWNNALSEFVIFYNGFYSYTKSAGVYDMPDPKSEFNWQNAEQYTGLKDKNGIEIYGEDLVKYLDWKPKSIEYCGLGFIGFNLKNTLKYLMDYDKKDIEVVGNIHENKELLNEI